MMSDIKMTRREILKYTGVGAVGLAIGATGFGSVLKVFGYDYTQPADDNNELENKIAFYGAHQSGIKTASQSHIYFASLTVLVNTKEELKELFQMWTPRAVRLMNGEQVVEPSGNGYIPPTDTGEALGVDASNLTITFGVGPSLFEKNYLGLQNAKPEELVDLPNFPRDQLEDAYNGGDICIQACADDPQVAFHAVRNLIRAASGMVEMKWSQAGFISIPKDGSTARNLFAFKDGTVNPKSETDYDEAVWVKSVDSQKWLVGGTYLIYRRIQMHLETWDRTALKEQEATFGRHRHSGAPLGKKGEFDDFDVLEKGTSGKYVIPENSHVHLAKLAKQTILRRAYSYSSGVVGSTGAYDAGLMFISFQKDPQQFIDIQNSLGRVDKLNEYITHRGSAIFACLPGVEKGSYLGEALFTSL
jgi:deferrochelatase/peroxidase EfeB